MQTGYPIIPSSLILPRFMAVEVGWGWVHGIRACEKLGYKGSGLENKLGGQGANGG